MENCIFCRIIKGEVPSYKVYEDKEVIAFLDIVPYVKGHLMVIPKKHSQWLWDMETKEYLALMEKVKFIAQGIRKAFKTDCVQEVVAGRGVPHVHVHLFQRQENDGLGEIPTKPIHPIPTPDEQKEIVEMIKKHL